MESIRERRRRACTASSQGGNSHSLELDFQVKRPQNIFTGHLISLYSWPQTGWQPVKRWSNWNLGNRNLPRKLYPPNHMVEAGVGGGFALSLIYSFRLCNGFGHFLLTISFV